MATVLNTLPFVRQYKISAHEKSRARLNSVMPSRLNFQTCATSKPPDGTVQRPQLVAWPGNRAAAISYTFDDALRDHIEIAAPLLDMFDFKGSFFVCPAQIPGTEEGARRLPSEANGSCGWDSLRRLAEKGHEIGSHSMTHEDLLCTSSEIVRQELQESFLTILNKVGAAPVSFAYPFNSRNEEVRAAVIEAGYLGAREEEIAFGGAGFTAADANALVDEAILQRRWLVPMIHGIKHGYDKFDDPSDFMRHLMHVKARADQVWVAPFGQVLTYTRQLETAHLNVERTRGGGLRIQVTLPRNFSNESCEPLLECPLFDLSTNTSPTSGAGTPVHHESRSQLVTGSSLLPMTVAVPAISPKEHVFDILIEVKPNGPPVYIPAPPAATFLGDFYVHLVWEPNT